MKHSYQSILVNIIKCLCLFQGTCQAGPKGDKGERGPPGMPAETRQSDFRLNGFCFFFKSDQELQVLSLFSNFPVVPSNSQERPGLVKK